MRMAPLEVHVHIEAAGFARFANDVNRAVDAWDGLNGTPIYDAMIRDRKQRPAPRNKAMAHDLRRL